jgi:ketosteroid isomerase-like protein
MKTYEIGTDLVKLCQEGKFMEAIDKHYADDIVSIEGASMPGMEQRMEGIDAIRGKGEWWAQNHEVHEMTAEGPFCMEGDANFAVRFYIDVTSKITGERNQSAEIAYYTVRDGKIAEERFYYYPRV